MGIPHKHAKVIKEWADGAVIQFSTDGVNWETLVDSPSWIEEHFYQVKPKSKTPGEIYFEAAYPHATFKGEKDQWERFEDGAKAVIEAYKRGDFN